MTWSFPTSMAALGAWLFLISIPLQVLMPKKSKVAVWFALLGGFGIGGGLGGWFGSALVNTRDKVAGATEQFTANAVGAGFGVLGFAIIAIFFLRHGGKEGKGIETKSTGKAAKVKAVGWLLAYAVLGCAVAAVPRVYGWANDVVHLAGTSINGLF